MTLNERIVDLCERKGISQSKLEKDLCIAKGSVTKWKTQEPRHSTIEKVADYFGVSVEYIMTGEDSNPDIPYYLNDDAREMAQFMFENPEYKVLFDASRKVKKEDIEFVKEMIDRMSNRD